MHEHRIAGLLDKASQRARDALELQGDADGYVYIVFCACGPGAGGRDAAADARGGAGR